MVMISLMSLVDGWAAFYQDSTPAQVTVQFLHTGGLLAAGGMALASDRNMLRVPVGDRSALIAMREAQEGIHVWVLTALAVVAASGVAFFLADRKIYWESVPFWLKMSAVALLIANGAWMLRLERACGKEPHDDGAWWRLRVSARASVALWFLTTLLGTVLSSAA
jgi:hypothetical protein